MYRAPVADLRFVLERLLDAGRLAQLPQFRDFSPEIVAGVLDEADRFAAGVLAPVNHSGDVAGAEWTASGVKAPPGYGDAYRQYVEGGWPQLGIGAEHGGQGAPQVLVSAVEEIWYGANVALMLCPMLSRGAIEALVMVGSPSLQKLFLPKMVTGEWMGTMNLTESQAGSDLAAAHARRAGGRPLPHLRAEDLHHLRRSRPHRQHHPPGAGADRWRAAGRASRCSWCPRT